MITIKLSNHPEARVCVDDTPESIARREQNGCATEVVDLTTLGRVGRDFSHYLSSQHPDVRYEIEAVLSRIYFAGHEHGKANR